MNKTKRTHGKNICGEKFCHGDLCEGKSKPSQKQVSARPNLGSTNSTERIRELLKIKTNAHKMLEAAGVDLSREQIKALDGFEVALGSKFKKVRVPEGYDKKMLVVITENDQDYSVYLSRDFAEHVSTCRTVEEIKDTGAEWLHVSVWAHGFNDEDDAKLYEDVKRHQRDRFNSMSDNEKTELMNQSNSKNAKECVEHLAQDYRNIPLSYYTESFGTKEGINAASNVVGKIDYNAIAKELFRKEGIGGQLGEYDGTEYDIGSGIYAYRQK